MSKKLSQKKQTEPINQPSQFSLKKPPKPKNSKVKNPNFISISLLFYIFYIFSIFLLGLDLETTGRIKWGLKMIKMEGEHYLGISHLNTI